MARGALSAAGQFPRIWAATSEMMRSRGSSAFQPQMRRKVLTQMRDGDYDGIIIAYSCFEMISLSQKYITEAMEAELQQIQNAIRQISTIGWKQTALEREQQPLEFGG